MRTELGAESTREAAVYSYGALSQDLVFRSVLASSFLYQRKREPSIIGEKRDDEEESEKKFTNLQKKFKKKI